MNIWIKAYYFLLFNSMIFMYISYKSKQFGDISYIVYGFEYEACYMAWYLLPCQKKML